MSGSVAGELIGGGIVYLFGYIMGWRANRRWGRADEGERDG